MPKTKISEFDSTPANNTDIDGINIAEGCAPSGINNAIRELMSQLKDQQTGASADNFTVGGNLAATGNLAVTGNSTFTGTITVVGSSTAASFSGAGTGLTGTASGLSIGGNAATATTCTGNAATASAPASGGSFITSSNIASQSVSSATTASSVGGISTPAPRPTASAVNGQWIPLGTAYVSGTVMTIPGTSGQTWAYFFSNNGQGFVSVVPGGTTVDFGSTPSNLFGFAWRVA